MGPAFQPSAFQADTFQMQVAVVLSIIASIVTGIRSGINPPKS